MLNGSLKVKTELERDFQTGNIRREYAKLARDQLLNECEVLLCRLQQSSVNFIAEGEDKFTVSSSSLSDALGLLTNSDTRIGLFQEPVTSSRSGWLHYKLTVAVYCPQDVRELHANAQVNC